MISNSRGFRFLCLLSDNLKMPGPIWIMILWSKVYTPHTVQLAPSQDLTTGSQKHWGHLSKLMEKHNVIYIFLALFTYVHLILFNPNCCEDYYQSVLMAAQDNKKPFPNLVGFRSVFSMLSYAHQVKNSCWY